MENKKRILGIAAITVLLAFLLVGCFSLKKEQGKIPIKVLILPKFEVGEMSGDFPGEAQLYYEEYVKGGDEYKLEHSIWDLTLYVKDGVALCVAGEGKVCSTANTYAVLSDERFDFSDAYIISTGCAGSAEGYGVMGDVYIITAAVDYDLGHTVDPRELEDDSYPTWFHDDEFDTAAVVKLDQKLTDRVYDLVKDVHLETTELTKKSMQETFPGEAWADRDPMVLKGTTASTDNFYKGEYAHQNALLVTETYECPDPYACSEMEDVGIGNVIMSFGMLDHYLIIRDSVNMDVFMKGMTPENLWGEEKDAELASGESEQTADIFETAMKNNFKVGKIVIDSILNDSL